MSVHNFDGAVDRAITQSMGRYTLSATNTNRVKGLAVEDVMNILRPLVEVEVSQRYDRIMASWKDAENGRSV